MYGCNGSYAWATCASTKNVHGDTRTTFAKACSVVGIRLRALREFLT